MYDELVNQLRHPWKYNGLIAELTNLAADVIEKLTEVIQNHDFLESLIEPSWISVTERLPKEENNG